MKKKLLQEQKEKAIIESFAKTFNKIKRLDENYMDESENTSESEFMETYPVGSQFKDSKYGAVKTIKKYEGDKVFIEDENMDGRMFQWPILYLIQAMAKKEYIPVEQNVDEINLKTLVPATMMAVGSMLPAKKAAAQNQMQQQQGIEKSVSDTSTAALPQDALKLGKTIYRSYLQDPFTADMWSKKSRENLRFFKMVKKLADYAANGGQIDYSDYEQLGTMAQESAVAANFLQRKKEDFNTARLEENINIHDKYTPLQQIHNAFNKLEKNDFYGWFNTYRNDLLKKEKNLITVTYNQAFSNGAYDAKGNPSKYEDGEDFYNKNFGQ
jgi:hypothetical protein